MQPSKVVDFCQALTFSGCWAGTLCVCRPIVKLIVEILLNLWLQWLQAVWCCLYMFVSYLLMKLLAQVYTVILYTWDVLDSITWCDISLYHCIIVSIYICNNEHQPHGCILCCTEDFAVKTWEISRDDAWESLEISCALRHRSYLGSYPPIRGHGRKDFDA